MLGVGADVVIEAGRRHSLWNVVAHGSSSDADLACFVERAGQSAAVLFVSVQTRYDYLIVGAGIVGLATAWRLREIYPLARIAVLEKEDRVAAHQSGHNSGVVHAGVYYPPDSLKARFCRAGIAATEAFCRTHAIAFERCGKLIVATSTDELPALDALAARAVANGLAIERLDANAIIEREPDIRGRAAIFVRDTAIADYPSLCRRLAELLLAHDGAVIHHAEVTHIIERADEVIVETSQGSFAASRLIVCAGLQADRVARLAGLAIDFAIVPFRGDYYTLPGTRSGLVKTLIYPVPDARLPFLGVHLTRTTTGDITLGPSAMLAFARETYRPWALVPRDAGDVLRFPGTWRLLTKFPRAGIGEFARTLSRRAYLAAVRRYCPALELTDLTQLSCGIRAQAVRRNGEMVHDFMLLATPRTLHVGNAPSPAATSAFPIADAIIERLGLEYGAP